MKRFLFVLLVLVPVPANAELVVLGSFSHTGDELVSFRGTLGYDVIARRFDVPADYFLDEIRAPVSSTGLLTVGDPIKYGFFSSLAEFDAVRTPQNLLPGLTLTPLAETTVNGFAEWSMSGFPNMALGAGEKWLVLYGDFNNPDSDFLLLKSTESLATAVHVDSLSLPGGYMPSDVPAIELIGHTAAVPEPTSIVAMGSLFALFGLGWLVKRARVRFTG